MDATPARSGWIWYGFGIAALLLFGTLGWWANDSLTDEFADVGVEITHLARTNSIPVAMALRDARRLAESLEKDLTERGTLWRQEQLVQERNARFAGAEIVDLLAPGSLQPALSTRDDSFDLQVLQPQLARLTLPGQALSGWAYERADSWWLPVFYRLRDGSVVVVSLPVSALVAEWGSPTLPGVSPIGLRGADDRVLFRQPFTPQMLGAPGAGTAIAQQMTAQMAKGQSSGLVRAVSVETDDIERLIGWALVPGSEVRLLVAVDAAQVAARWRANTAPKFAALAALMALALAVAVFLQQRERRYVTRLVRTQQDLAHTAKTLERMCSIARIGAWEADVRSGRMQLSAVARELHGIQPDERLPLWRDFRGAFGQDAAARLQAAKLRLVEHGESYDLVLPIHPTHPIPADGPRDPGGGATRWVRSVGSPHFDGGSVERLEGAVQDVTSLVETQARESALNSRARMLAEAVATSSQLVLVTDPDERITWCNEAFVKVSGWTLQEVLGKKPSALLQRGTVPEEVNALMRRHLHARQGFAGVRLQNFSKGGQAYWVDLEVRPMHDEGGELEGFVGVQTDVTHDIEREQALMEATRRVERATENAAIGLWDLDLSTDVARWNGQMFQKFGFDPAHGQPSTGAMWATLHEEGGAAWKADFLRHAADPLAARWRGEFRVRNAAGGWRWLRSECAFERADDGRGLRALGTTVDVTAEHEAADERAARAEADARNHAKTAFLSRMSHELRTPLNAVIGYAQLLGGGATPLPEAALERIQRIERSGWHLLALIDDVLDLSRIESHAMSVTPVRMSLSDVAREAALGVEPRMLQMGLTLELDLPPIWVHADAKRVQQILSNLLSNAVKYNRPGGTVSVRLRLCLRPSLNLPLSQTLSQQDTMACVEVADTGLGLTTEQQAMLFEPFNRLGRETSGIEGTGIGLSIVRALAKLMDGDIGVSSVAGQGSVFSLFLPLGSDKSEALSLPLAEPEAQSVEPEPSASTPLDDCTLDVLCVEDNEVNAILLEESIRRLRPSWTVRHAGTAAAALQTLRDAPCDLLLLDINLPDQSGLQMLALARQHSLVATAQVVVLSADVMPETRRAAREAGVTQFLDKPFRLSDLKRVLGQAALAAG